jgi:hypothetical protein
MEKVKDRIQRWLFGYYLKNWLLKHVTHYATQTHISTDELLLCDEKLLREKIKYDMLRKIVDKMMKEDVVMFEEGVDSEIGGRIYTARFYSFKK